MQLNKAVIAYWQACQQQEALNLVTNSQLKNFWHKINSQEIAQGRLIDQSLIQSLLAKGEELVIAPCFAQRGEDYFFPYLLSIKLAATGQFIPQLATALPIFPRAALEPAGLQPICLGNADNFYNYNVMNPPVWQDDIEQLTWENQLAYANQTLEAGNCNTWQIHLQQVGYVIQDGALAFSLHDLWQPREMDVKLLKKSKKIELINADLNCDRSTYITKQIIDAWIIAGVQNAPPPQIVWHRYGAAIRYANIFACNNVHYDEVNSTDLHVDLPTAHAKLNQLYAAYCSGVQLVQNWQDVIKQLQEKYADKGGIEARLLQLRSNNTEAKVHNRHMQVLYSIWLRQVDLISNTTSFLDFIPKMQNRRLSRLYNFFKQNFSEQNVAGKSLKQLHEIMQEKKHRAENSERFVGDALHQIENDLLQVSIVREKYQQWLMEQNLIVGELNIVSPELPEQICADLLQSAIKYWQFACKTNADFRDFLTSQPDQIDLLIVEHAEYVSPMQAAELFAISQRALIFGNYNPLANPRFSVLVDYELAKQFKLVTCDEEFEDLQFEGVAGSVGNLWNLATQGMEADRNLTVQHPANITYEYIDIVGVNENYLGSGSNSAEVVALLAWLDENHSLVGDLAIYTCFSGQAHQVAEALLDASFANIPILKLQEPSFNKYATLIFLPVYTAADPGPYAFDQGSEMLDNMLANVKERLIVMGDMRIFKPQLHSPAGKFAQMLLTSHSAPINIIEKEVDCV